MSFEQGASLHDGRYELRRRIGSGGMASVWLAMDTRLERPVAIKIPTEGLAADHVFARRFEREARLAASLSHPNLVPVYDYGSEDDRPYLVMEYIDGESLAELHERGGAVDAADLARALLGALEHIHAAGIVHRDVKPGNVLVERNGRILLTDFGIAQAAEATQLTGTGQVIGTLRYIAPEVMAGERASPRSDLYACGILLGECIEPSDPPALHRLVAELSADDPSERPGSATSALAQAPRPPAGSVDGVERTTAVADPTEPITVERSDTRRPESPAPRPPRPPALPPRSPTPRPTTRPRPTPTTRPTPATGPGMLPRVVLGLAIIAAAVAIAVALAASSDDEQGSGDRGAGQQQEQSSDKGAETGTDAAPTTETDTTEPGLPAPSANPNPARGFALNDEGFAQFKAGDFESAVATLRKAVRAYPADSTDINYGYALYNYGMALLESDDPAAAVAPLTKRLEFTGDTELVQQQLDRALAEAGQG